MTDRCRWEYKVKSGLFQHFHSVLDALGEEEWELVSYDTHEIYYTAVFKRPRG